MTRPRTPPGEQPHIQQRRGDPQPMITNTTAAATPSARVGSRAGRASRARGSDAGEHDRRDRDRHRHRAHPVHRRVFRSRDSAMVHASAASTTRPRSVPRTPIPTTTAPAAVLSRGSEHRTGPGDPSPHSRPRARDALRAALRSGSTGSRASPVPRPCPHAARAAISHTGPDMSSGSAEATENTARPAISTTRRP